MLAYHNDPAIKTKYLDRVKAHADADEIVKGQYWENGKGCAVGCTIHGSDHLDYETELGIPAHLAHLEDYLFENLPNGQAKNWPYLFLDSISVGTDLSRVWQKWILWQLGDPKHGVLKYTQKRDDTYDAVQWVIEPYRDWPWPIPATAAAWAAWAAKVEARTTGTVGTVGTILAAAVQAQADKLIELLRNERRYGKTINAHT